MFANTLTGLMGVVTCTMLWIPIPLLHWTGHEIFELPALNQLSSVLMIATMGLIYNGCFMIVVSQTSPVFAAVGVMATIPLVALTDWILFDQAVGWGNMVGGLSILVGFGILVRENQKAL
jgi:drug/metabolite transporter (DMT)-like permease